jgi:hypothetical protein
MARRNTAELVVAAASRRRRRSRVDVVLRHGLLEICVGQMLIGVRQDRLARKLRYGQLREDARPNEIQRTQPSSILRMICATT